MSPLPRRKKKKKRKGGEITGSNIKWQIFFNSHSGSTNGKYLSQKKKEGEAARGPTMAVICHLFLVFRGTGGREEGGVGCRAGSKHLFCVEARRGRKDAAVGTFFSLKRRQGRGWKRSLELALTGRPRRKGAKAPPSFGRGGGKREPSTCEDLTPSPRPQKKLLPFSYPHLAKREG